MCIRDRCRPTPTPLSASMRSSRSAPTACPPSLRPTVSPSTVQQMATGLTYAALAEGDCDVSMGFATDGRIARLGLMNLEDDQNFFPAYFPAPNVRTEVLETAPEVADHLNCLAASLSTATMTELNARVDSDGESVRDVAADHLADTSCLGDK